tara:strand:+ start:6001 stop:6612 length:612 start_codon:yes stop_codon:yes gene_type:complete
MGYKQNFIKRTFDFLASLVGLILVFPIIFLSWLIASIETRSNGFFLQGRVGKEGRVFKLIKIKTMVAVGDFNTNVTQRDDIRITITGSFFRKTKIDEFPQLWNVLIGQMSIVGPRPDVPGYADKLQGKDRRILSVRAGITGPAQLAYKNEEDILANQNNPIQYNDEVIWPDKVKINLDYVKNYSFCKDLHYIWKSITGGNAKY